MKLVLTIAATLAVVYGTSPSAEQITHLQKINDHRQKNGKPPLCIVKSLKDAAEMQSSGQASMNRMTHEGIAGQETLEKRLKLVGFVGNAWAENVGLTSSDSLDTVFNAWINSPGHNGNMLNAAYNCFGNAKVFNGTSYFWTQDFGTCSEPCLSGADAGSAQLITPLATPPDLVPVNPVPGSAPTAPTTTKKACPYAEARRLASLASASASATATNTPTPPPALQPTNTPAPAQPTQAQQPVQIPPQIPSQPLVTPQPLVNPPQVIPQVPVDPASPQTLPTVQNQIFDAIKGLLSGMNAALDSPYDLSRAVTKIQSDAKTFGSADPYDMFMIPVSMSNGEKKVLLVYLKSASK